MAGATINHTDPNALQRELESLRALLLAKDELIAKLERHVELYKKLAFGRPSEKRRVATEPIDPRQGHLFAALLAEANDVARREPAVGTIEELHPGRRKKKARRRTDFPDHVPHFKTTYELPESERECTCGALLEEIGEAVSKELDRIETTLVHVIARKKYACKRCFGAAKTAPGPDRVIEGGLLAPGFLAHVIAERFLNHMPYYRQEQKYKSEGLALSRTVLERSAARCGELLLPVYEQIKKEVLGQDVVFTDDTPVTIAQDSQGKSRQGRVWIYTDLERRLFYDFTESRKRDGPLAMLRNFRGYVHADAYPGYDPLFLPGQVKEVACMAHGRRYVLDAEDEEPALVKEGIGIIRELYRVEAEAKERGLTPEQRKALRDQRSRPLMAALKAWLDRAEREALPKGKLAEAVRYFRNQWDALNTFLEDGRLEIDNNRSERSLRCFAVGRKNWLFFESPQGGKTAVVLMSLVRTAQEIGVDPKIYLRDVLTRIARESDITRLTPHGWKQHFMADVMAALRGTTTVAASPLRAGPSN